MSLFWLLSWWHYRRKALSRHGIHSPFVYRFVEESLRPPLQLQTLQAFREADHFQYRPRTRNLLARCTQFLKNESSTQDAGYKILNATTETLRRTANQHLPAMREGLCLLIPDIHHTPGRQAVWDELCADARVNLSLDIGRVGLLFFRKDFLEKQHFVLRPRG